MNNPITATEVQMRAKDFERRQAPKLQARAEAMILRSFGEFLLLMRTYLRDAELQQHRMTDDGCPLGALPGEFA